MTLDADATQRGIDVEIKYEAFLWQSKGARNEVDVLDQAICALRKQRRALKAKADKRDTALCDFIRAHRDEIREIEDRHQDARRAELAEAAS